MPRAHSSVPTRHRRNKYLKAAKGYFGGKHSQFKAAKEQVETGWQYAYRDRRNGRRAIRALWIARINAAARLHGMNYSTLIDAMNKKNIAIDRKMLADLAVKDNKAFGELVANVQN
ncbi:MAG TPA: 50S ribosomal protein L20 [bacterium]|jgi:large subunit ribosomal protein L20|nr:50S ribosomal protein L20 [bacterium]HNT65499.1 50S ribosomal protein L20 [bacterium]HOX87564.1 50S ribosomal protein L20 [bacterium]HPG47252.1 50S ribosomal protein L20 [bacterium]HPM99542.1 50S ribosomal protein L20 [bacterium]